MLAHPRPLTLETACQLQAFLATMSMNDSPKLESTERFPEERVSSSLSVRHRLASVWPGLYTCMITIIAPWGYT